MGSSNADHKCAIRYCADGGTATGNGGTVTYTIGQIAVQSYGEGCIRIFEGAQQPYEIQTIGIDNYPSITLNAMVYPNPTTSNLQ